MTTRNGQAAAIEQQVNIVHLFTMLNGIMTEFTALVRGLMVNGILFSGAPQIGASGIWSKDFDVPFAFVHVVNLGTASVTVTSDAPQSAAPGLGAGDNTGAKVVPANASLGFNLAGRALSVYGANGTQLNVEIHVKPDRAQP